MQASCSRPVGPPTRACAGSARSVLERGVPGGDVRRIREYEIEALVSDGGEPGSHPPFDLGQPEGGGIVAGDPGRRFGDVDADDARAAAFEGEGEGEDAAPRAQIQHGGRIVDGQELERPLDQELGFRTRHQDGGGHLEAAGTRTRGCR